MQWQVERGIRCDLVAYAARNLSGKRSPIQWFPAGNSRGDVAPNDLASLVIRAPHGVRVILITEPGPDWKDHPWRCIRMVEGNTVPGAKTGLPGVRLPDLDLLDGFDAKKTDPDLESSYPHADGLDGDGWTFGRIGRLKKRVQLIRIEKERAAPTESLPDADALARRIVEKLGTEAIDAVADALQTTLTDAGHTDTEARVGAFRRWTREWRSEESS